MNYNKLVSTPSQVRYADACQSFAVMANLATNDDSQTHAIME